MRTRHLRVAASVVFAVSLLLATAIQLGPAARLAAAHHLSCSDPFEGQTHRQDLGNGSYVVWRCAFGSNFRWYWAIVQVGNDEEEDNMSLERFYQAGIYQVILQAAAGTGTGYGHFHANYELRGPSGTPMERVMAVRLLIQYAPVQGAPYTTCGDTGWKQAPVATSKYRYWVKYDSLKCGRGWYRVQTAGRFLSVSTGQWVTHSWVNSGGVAIKPPV
jgi:hypothetical protein